MWEQIARIINQLALSVRIILNNGTITDWSKWLGFPSNSYGEVMGYGPFLIKEVQYIEINPVEKRKLGRLLPEKKIDHSKELEEFLIYTGIPFQRISGIYRIERGTTSRVWIEQEGITVKLRGYSKAAREDIQALENTFRYKLPKEYINFLLSYDGAEPDTNIFSVESNNNCGINRFIPCKDIIQESIYIDHVSQDMIPIAWAECGNYLIISLITGKIFFWDHEIPDKQIELAPSIFAFLEQLEPFDINSVELKEWQVESVWIDPDFLKN